jgi:hypothetical protein
VPFPTRLAPTLAAGMSTRQEAKAADAYLSGMKDKNVIVSEGKVVSFNKNGLVQAALQVAQLKRGYVSTDKEVAEAISRSVGNMRKLKPQDGHALSVLVDGSQRIYLWFPTAKAMALLVVRSQISEGAAEALARGLISYGEGEELNESALSAAFAAAPTPSPTPSTKATP